MLSKHRARESQSKSQLSEPGMSSSTRAGGRRACKGVCLQQFTSGWVAPPTKHGHMRLWRVALEKARAGPADSLLKWQCLWWNRAFYEAATCSPHCYHCIPSCNVALIKIIHCSVRLVPYSGCILEDNIFSLSLHHWAYTSKGCTRGCHCDQNRVCGF